MLGVATAGVLLVAAWTRAGGQSTGAAVPDSSAVPPGLRAPTPQPLSTGEAAITAAEIREAIAVLADDSLEGRQAGTPGAERAAAWIAGRFEAIGLAAPESGYLQPFDIPAGAAGAGTRVSFAPAGTSEPASVIEAPVDVAPLGFSAPAAATGPLALDAPNAPAESLRGSVVLVADPGPTMAALRERAAALATAGAAAVLVLSDPSAMTFAGRAADLSPLSIPALAVSYAAGQRLAEAAGIDLMTFAHGGPARATAPVDISLVADLEKERAHTSNVIGILEGADPALRHEAVLIGAHYDHLGWGGPGSLAPGVRAIHNGADDNASGVAGLLELAEWFAGRRPGRSLVFVAFGAEEAGNLGSQHYLNDPAWPRARTIAMLNLDMIGRPSGKLVVSGTGTSSAWPALLDSLEAAGEAPGPGIARVPDGVGPSDHASFYAARIPVLALFTGAHADYHKPTDDVERIEAEGEARVLGLVAALLQAIAGSDHAIPFTEAPVTKPAARSFKVALGTMPDYGFEGPGVRLAGVRPGSPAEEAGLAEGDVVVSLAGREVADVYGYTAVLAEIEPGRPVELIYVREGDRRTGRITPEAR